MMTSNTKMITVLHTYPTGAHLFCFINRNLHRIRRHNQPKSTITINDCS